jgi:anoctamin-5
MTDNLELVHVFSGKSEEDESDEMYLLVHAPFYRLALECQSVKIDMPLEGQTNPRNKTCCLLNCLETDDEVDFITAPFNLTRLSIYEGSDDLREFFQPAIAGLLTHHILINTDSQEEKDIKRGTTTKGLSYLLHIKAYEDAFVLHPYSPNDPLNKAFTKGLGQAHDICFQPDLVLSNSNAIDEGKPDLRQELADTWCRWFKFQPLWKIRNYFGEKLAFYFAWIGLLTNSLVVPSLLGSGVFIFGVTYSSSQNVTNVYDWMLSCFDNTATPVFSLIMCVWGTLFLELWKRKHARLQYEWDVGHYDETEPDRPQFYGTAVVEDPVTKLEEVFYPLSRKLAKLTASLLVVFFMILLVLASLVAVIVYRLIFEHDWLTEERIKSVPGDNFLPTLSASVLNGISILILKQVYNRLAWKLTDWENHRTQSAYEDSLIVKLFAFHSVNSYASLFYIAFFRNAEYEEGFAGLGHKYRDSCGDTNDCMTMLTIQVAVLMVMQPLPKFIKDYVWPYVVRILQIYCRM